MADSDVRTKLQKFTKFFTLKFAHVVVQSRQGRKITREVAEETENSSSVQWFNLSIPDVPEVTLSMKDLLNGQIMEALAQVFCIEISLHTDDGYHMVLEYWTVKVTPGSDMGKDSVSTIYTKMGTILKSVLTVSRIPPAYKLSRNQHKDSYKIMHRIYLGEPRVELLGDKTKTIKISEIKTLLGTLHVEFIYRSELTIPPQGIKDVDKAEKETNNEIMVKSDHFPKDSPRKDQEKKDLDLSRPLSTGAFVDANRIRQLHLSLNSKMAAEAALASAKVEQEKTDQEKPEMLKSNEREVQRTSTVAIARASGSSVTASGSAPVDIRRTDVPRCKHSYKSLIEFPFAEGSPITELANFCQECLHAKSVSEEWTDVVAETSTSTDSETLSQQLKMFEDAVPEFDSMVASMFSNSDTSEHS